LRAAVIFGKTTCLMETLEVTPPEVKSAYELERGKPMPTWNHAVLQKRILIRVESKYEGQFSVLPELNLGVGETKLVPDLCVFAGPDIFLPHDNPLVTQMPLTTVEILSPSQTVTELSGKVEQYLLAGVKSCWIVVPEFCIVVVSTKLGSYQTFERHETLTDSATGIELDLEQLFK